MANPTLNRYKKVHDFLLSFLDVPLQIIGLLETFVKENPDPKAYDTYNANLHTILQNHCSNPNRDLKKEILETTTVIEDFIDSFPEMTKAIQLQERYQKQPGDKFFVKTGKFFKRIRLSFKKGRLMLGNIFRKNKKPFTFHTHRIPENRLARHIFLNAFLKKTNPSVTGFMHIKVEALLELYKLHEHIQHSIIEGEKPNSKLITEKTSEIKQSIQEACATIEFFIADFIQEANQDFSMYKEKCGTIEFPNRKIRRGKLNRKRRKSLQKLTRTIKTAETLCFSINEYWKVKTASGIYLTGLKEHSTNHVHNLKKSANQKVSKHLNQVVDILDNGITCLETTKPPDFEHESLEKIKSHIPEIAPLLNQLIIDLNTESFYDWLIADAEKLVAVFPQQIYFNKNIEVSKKHKVNLSKKVDAADLFSGMLQKKNNKTLLEDRKTILRKTQQLYQNLDEIVHVVEYSFEYFSNQTGLSIEEAKNELLNGIKRSQNKAKENIQSIDDILDFTEKAFHTYVDKNIESVKKITDPDWMAKSSRIWLHKKRGNRWAENLKNLAQKTWPQIKKGVNKTVDFYRFTRKKYFNLRSILGISVEKESISSELSNYLANTSYAITQLPLMYQRLFVNTPLTDKRFYTHRNTVEQKLNEAYENWKRKRYAPTCMVGENGCGTTTMLNFFVSEKVEECQVTRIILNEKVISEKSLVTVLNSHFSNFDSKDLQDFKTKINGHTQRHVVIIENIHHMFLRKHDGYTNLIAFLNLLSYCNNNVFWLLTCNIYAWKHLNYTHNVADYFGHVIEFNLLRKETVINAISIRHKPSGFNMRFLVPENTKLKRQYHKLSEEDKQEFLKNHFFEHLHQSVQGNLSLAFLLWLRSVEKTEENSLYFRFKKINHAFLNNLGVQKTTSLYAILIHSGLSAEEHSLVFPMDVQQSENLLMLMTNDAILEKRNNTYILNPLLYRQIINYLQSANFIH